MRTLAIVLSGVLTGILMGIGAALMVGKPPVGPFDDVMKLFAAIGFALLIVFGAIVGAVIGFNLAQRFQ